MAITTNSWSEANVPGIIAQDINPLMSKIKIDVADSEYNISEYPIQGKMVLETLTISSQELFVNDTEIKNILAKKIAETLINQKLVEFTKSQDPIMDQWTFRARVFVTPDTQVKILRENKK